MTPRGKLVRDRRGSTAVEFALVTTTLTLMLFGTVNIGLILWTQSTLQSIAGLAARCGALASASCANTTLVQTYAVNKATAMIMANVIASTNVTALSAQTTCPASGFTAPTGKFYSVAISSSFFQGGLFPVVLGNYAINARACYPM